MASVNRGSSMRGGRSRRSMSDINVVPYIDVMLVLLVIFMVTAPLVTPGTVDVPSVGKSAQAPPAYIEVMIKADKSMKVAIRGEHGQADQNLASIADLISLVKQRQAIDPASPPPVIIAADKTVQYDAVLQVMDALQKQNVKHVGLSVKPAPPGS